MPTDHALSVSIALLLTAGLALADPATPEVQAVKTQMEGSFGQDFSDVRPHTDGARQARAVWQSLKTLRQDSGGVLDDLRMMKRITARLERAFPDEFPTQAGKLLLGDVVDSALDDLAGRVGSERDALAARVDGLSGRTAERVSRLIGKADARLASSSTASTRRRRAKRAYQGARLLFKGARKAGPE